MKRTVTKPTGDSGTYVNLVAEVVKQCRTDIAVFFRDNEIRAHDKSRILRERRINAAEAIRFLYSPEFDWYLNLAGLPHQDFDDYRRAVVSTSIKEESEDVA